MVTLPVTLRDPKAPSTQTSTFFVAFHIIIVREDRDFKFRVQVYYSKSQPMDDKLSLKEV